MVRFLADASLNHDIVAACLRREPAMDFLSAVDAKLEGVSDPEVLALAAHQGRILVTHDLHTMPWHFANFLWHAAGVQVSSWLVSVRLLLRSPTGFS